MSRSRRYRGLLPAMLLVLALSFGCARRAPDVPAEGTIEGRQTPFQSQGATDTDEQGFSTVDTHGAGLPFQNSDVIPAGSLLSVRLKVPLVAVSGSTEAFEAALDGPLLVDGNVLIPGDAVVSGEIESTHVSKAKPDRGYVRLTLDSVQVDGVPVPIQTASLFARQVSGANADPVAIRLERGRRLTFRLKEKVFLHPNVSRSSQ